MNTRPTADFATLAEATRKAFAPALQLNELAMQGFQHAARQQHAFAGELLELALAQMQLPTQAGDVNELAARQVELTTQLVEKTTQRSQEFVKLAGEQQAELSRWFDTTAAEYGAAAKSKAA